MRLAKELRRKMLTAMCLSYLVVVIVATCSPESELVQEFCSYKGHHVNSRVSSKQYSFNAKSTASRCDLQPSEISYSKNGAACRALSSAGPWRSSVEVVIAVLGVAGRRELGVASTAAAQGTASIVQGCEMRAPAIQFSADGRKNDQSAELARCANRFCDDRTPTFLWACADVSPVGVEVQEHQFIQTADALKTPPLDDRLDDRRGSLQDLSVVVPVSRVQHVDEAVTADNYSSFPYFDFNVARNVTTAVGQTAFLHCRVEQLGDKGVSWIRKRDLHILTAGILTYTSDARFQVIRPDKSDNWTLQIKFPQDRDSGIYECQVNTEPKMSLAFRLNVIEAKARIVGPTDLYVKTGSAVTLTCIINQGPHDLGTVFWYRGTTAVQATPTTTPLREHEPAPRVSVDTKWTDELTSRLRITRARTTDSGNYTCLPTVAEPASVNVHVINGEHPAAMQHGNKNSASVSLSLHIFVYSFTVFLIKRMR